MTDGLYKLIYKGPNVNERNTRNPAGFGWFFTEGSVKRLPEARRHRDVMAAQFGGQGYKYELRRVS